VEGLQRGDPIARWEVLSPLLFMGKGGPRGKMMEGKILDMFSGRPELPMTRPPGIDTGRNMNLPSWAREQMLQRGMNPKRTFNDVDLANPSVREAINSDPTLSPEQKAHLLKTGALPPPPGMDVMPIPGQPPLTQAGRSNILEDKIITQKMLDMGIKPPSKINPAEDFKPFQAEENQDNNPFNWMEEPPVHGVQRGKIFPDVPGPGEPDRPGMFPDLSPSEIERNLGLFQRGMLPGQEGKPPVTTGPLPPQEQNALLPGTEGWYDPRTGELLPGNKELLQDWNKLPPPPKTQPSPPPFKPPGDTSEPPSGYPPWWLTQNIFPQRPFEPGLIPQENVWHGPEGTYFPAIKHYAPWEQQIAMV
jgi:hypothetical protein